MLLVRAPVRISLAGGGTDLEDYYRSHGGMVVSAAIDKYFYVFVSHREGEGVHIGSSDYRCFYRLSSGGAPVWEGDLRLPQAVLHEFGLTQGLSIFLASEIPPGTGLGSSSTVTVALVKAFSTLCGLRLGPAEIAERAYGVENVKLGRPCGKQDQYAAAFGGINSIQFEREAARVSPISLDPSVRNCLKERLLLFFLGSARKAGAIGRAQQRATRAGKPEVMDALHYLRRTAETTEKALQTGEIERLGAILRDSWEQKKHLAPDISNPFIDEVYAQALAAGAAGGKVTGAGGGGFLLLYCEPERRGEVCAAMDSLGLYRMDFHFDMGGAKVLMNSGARNGHSPVALSFAEVVRYA